MSLDRARLARLRHRLVARLAAAPSGALVSVSLDLGPGEDDWLRGGLGAAPFAYWAEPEAGDWRLGLGRAITFATGGAARFPALQAAFAGLAQAWVHDDEEGTGATPAAFLGFAFDHASSAEPGLQAGATHEQAYGNWPNALLAVPSLLFQRRAGRCSLTFSCAARDGAGALDAALALLPTAASGAAPWTAAAAATSLSARAWRARVDAALADIAAGRLDKVVLARSLRLHAARPFRAAPLLAALLRCATGSTVYAFGEDGQCFLGATPESLVALADGVARADALAGTAWLQGVGTAGGAAPRLLCDEKNGREQRLVVDAVQAALAPVCECLKVAAAPEVLRLRELRHLRSRFEGRVRPGVGLFELVARLHPTPAVGGAPTAAALDWLRRHGERRGAWYAGGVGWVGRDGAGEVRVALRCAHVTGCEAELYAGAGIVAGSDPAEEWSETEAKLATMLDAFAHPVPSVPACPCTSTR